MNWVIWMKKVWFFHFLTLYTNEKIYFDEKKDATIIYTKPIETILLISNSLNLYKQKKTGQFRPVFCCCSPCWT